MANSQAKNKRIASATQAWRECYNRLAPLYSASQPSNPSLSAELSFAEDETASYISGNRNAKPREALARWEEMMRRAIATANGDRTCSECGQERVAIVVTKDGCVVCGRCRRGFTSG